MSLRKATPEEEVAYQLRLRSENERLEAQLSVMTDAYTAALKDLRYWEKHKIDPDTSIGGRMLVYVVCGDSVRVYGAFISKESAEAYAQSKKGSVHKAEVICMDVRP